MSGSASNYYKETWVDNTVPRVMESSQLYNFTVTVRNDGWDTWNETEMYRLGYTVVPEGNTPQYADYGSNRSFLPTGVNVNPGQSYTFNVSFTAPINSGHYDIFFDMVKDGTTWFFDKNNNSLSRSIIVASDANMIDTDNDGASDIWETDNSKLYWHPDDRDSISPTGSITINNGDEVTNDTNIIINLTAEDDSGFIFEYRISNDGINWQPWDNYAINKPYLLDDTQGIKTLYAQFRDHYKNESDIYSDNIILDTGGPLGSIIINSGNACTTSENLEISIDSNDAYSSVQSMRFSNDNILWSEWETFTNSKNWIITPTPGQKEVYAEFMDLVGNISQTYSDTIMMGILGDFDCDGQINVNDLSILCNHWLFDDCTNLSCENTDLSDDGKINLKDFSVFSELWQIDINK